MKKARVILLIPECGFQNNITANINTVNPNNGRLYPSKS